MRTATVPFPFCDVAGTWIHPTGEVAVQVHPATVCTCTDAVPPAESVDTTVGVTV
jgi:hypothetical protein